VVDGVGDSPVALQPTRERRSNRPPRLFGEDGNDLLPFSDLRNGYEASGVALSDLICGDASYHVHSDGATISISAERDVTVTT
jgi:hypothetical protein